MKTNHGSLPAASPGQPKRALGRRRRHLRWAAGVLITATLIGAGVTSWLYLRSRPEQYRPGEDHPEITRTLQREIPPEAPMPRLAEVAQSAGLGSYRAFAGPRSSQLPEDMGPGAAWGDYDNDGDEDLFLVSAGGALSLPPRERAPSLLYENLGDGTFRPVRDFPETRIIGMGAAWGDYDADGWLDLVVTGYHSLILYRNDRGRFTRAQALPDLAGFWAGATWADYDNDRDLDLYICGYVQYEEADASAARVSQQYGRSVPYTLNPASYKPERNLLFRNDGDGAFTEVAAELGLDNLQGRSLGALWHDFDDDGWLDLYVANDISDNVLYWNRGGTFEDISHAAWVADYRGAMGLAVADWDRDGDDDLFVSHWIAQENALYDSLLVDFKKRRPNDQPGAAGERAAAPAWDGEPRFMDTADARGLGYIALQFVGWGAEFADFDADGWLDLVVSNGSTFETGDTPPRLRSQEPFLLWNQRGQHYHNLALLHDVLRVPRVGRGLALADYDNDGDVDILFVTRDSGVLLLRNDMQTGNWVKLRLRSRAGDGKGSFGFGDGAKLVARVGEAVLRRAPGGPSYLSQSSRIVHFGLGEATRIDSLQVRWLGGETVSYEGLEAGTEWELTEGDPRPRRIGSDSPVGGGAHSSSGGARPGQGSAAATGTAASPAGSDPSPESKKERLLRFWEKQRAAMHAIKVEKDIPRAAGLFREALELDPSHEDARYYLANCLAALGDVPGALEQFEELTRVSPRGSRGYRRWGTLRAVHAGSKADLLEAKEALERAFSINREEIGSLQVLGEIELLLGEIDAAEQRFSWICRTNPRAAAAFFLRGYIAWKRGNGDEARDLLERAREALGPEWIPKGTTSEGDVGEKLHSDITPLSPYLEAWDGSIDPHAVYAALDARL